MTPFVKLYWLPIFKRSFVFFSLCKITIASNMFFSIESIVHFDCGQGFWHLAAKHLCVCLSHISFTLKVLGNKEQGTQALKKYTGKETTSCSGQVRWIYKKYFKRLWESIFCPTSLQHYIFHSCSRSYHLWEHIMAAGLLIDSVRIELIYFQYPLLENIAVREAYVTPSRTGVTLYRK